MDDRILLDAGSGGRASQRLISQCFMRHFSNPLLDRMDDAALLDIKGPLAMSTDSYTVTPLFFAGGSIGTLAVHGTVNDVAMLGARPRYLSCASGALHPRPRGGRHGRGRADRRRAHRHR